MKRNRYQQLKIVLVALCAELALCPNPHVLGIEDWIIAYRLFHFGMAMCAVIVGAILWVYQDRTHE